MNVKKAAIADAQSSRSHLRRVVANGYSFLQQIDYKIILSCLEECTHIGALAGV